MAVALEFADLLYQMRLQAIPSALRDVEANPWALLSEDRLSETLDRCRQCLLDEDSSEIPRDATSKLRKMLDILVDRGAYEMLRPILGPS
eukprot:tig00021123_g18524.t1